MVYLLQKLLLYLRTRRQKHNTDTDTVSVHRTAPNKAVLKFNQVYLVRQSKHNLLFSFQCIVHVIVVSTHICTCHSKRKGCWLSKAFWEMYEIAHQSRGQARQVEGRWRKITIHSASKSEDKQCQSISGWNFPSGCASNEGQPHLYKVTMFLTSWRAKLHINSLSCNELVMQIHRVYI